MLLTLILSYSSPPWTNIRFLLLFLDNNAVCHGNAENMISNN